MFRLRSNNSQMQYKLDVGLLRVYGGLTKLGGLEGKVVCSSLPIVV